MIDPFWGGETRSKHILASWWLELVTASSWSAASFSIRRWEWVICAGFAIYLISKERHILPFWKWLRRLCSSSAFWSVADLRLTSEKFTEVLSTIQNAWRWRYETQKMIRVVMMIIPEKKIEWWKSWNIIIQKNVTGNFLLITWGQKLYYSLNSNIAPIKFQLKN